MVRPKKRIVIEEALSDASASTHHTPEDDVFDTEAAIETARQKMSIGDVQQYLDEARIIDWATGVVRALRNVISECFPSLFYCLLSFYISSDIIVILFLLFDIVGESITHAGPPFARRRLKEH